MADRARQRHLAPLVCALGLLAAQAIGQVPAADERRPSPHGLRPGPRPLQTRLALGDAVVLVVVDAVGEGRIRVRDAVALVGRTDSSFEIKRSPLSPPLLVPDESALLVLKGARSPYLLIDEAREIVHLEGDTDWQRWTRAVAELVATQADGGDLLELYAAWLEGEAKDLREEAVGAVADPRTGFIPLPERFVAGRVASALDPRKPTGVRSASAYLATLDRAGSERLLAVLAGPEGGAIANAELITLTLRAGLGFRMEATRDLLLRSLAHPDVAVRRAALTFAPFVAADAALHEALARIARDEVDSDVKAQAQRALRKISRSANGGEGDGHSAASVRRERR